MPATVINLALLESTDGFIIQGDTAYDYAGFSVSSAGDVNGDGIDDIILGAYRGDDGGNYAGEAYVIYGRAGNTRGRIDLTSLAPADGFTIQGDDTNDQAGFSVSGAGDVNGDGIGDLIIGAPTGADGGTYAGEAYVIYGQRSNTRTTLDLTGLAASDGFVIQGDAAYDYAGWSVSDGGDINGDGTDDLIVSAHFADSGGRNAGEVFVVYGQSGSTRGRLDLTDFRASDGFVIQGDASGDTAGYSVSGVGDVNGDGIDDLIIGAPRGDDGGTDAGEAYIIYGSRDSARTLIDLTGLSASDGFVVRGDAAGDRAGFNVSGAGDINGDGIGDLIIGAPRGDDGGTSAGEAYVVYGRKGSDRTIVLLTGLAPSDGFAIQGDAAIDQAGYVVSGAGDINGDGIGDLIVGAPLGDDGGDYAGEAYVIYGVTGSARTTIDLTGLDASDGFIIQGVAAPGESGEEAGGSVSAAGDINSDGIDDIIVGARAADDGGTSAGQAYVLYGRLEAGAIGGTRASDFLIGTASTDAVYGLAGDDLIYGNFGNDRLYGANGNDALFGEDDDDTVAGGAGFDKVDGGSGNDIVSGGADSDSLRGGAGDDVLDGGADGDALHGGTGIDILTGGGGRDKFRFGDGDTGATMATADRITDLDQVQGERISLTLIDAIVGGDDDAFAFIGTDAFGDIAGQLRYEVIGGNTYVMGDTNGDSIADFMIRLDAALVLTTADFSL